MTITTQFLSENLEKILKFMPKKKFSVITETNMMTLMMIIIIIITMMIIINIIIITIKNLFQETNINSKKKV